MKGYFKPLFREAEPSPFIKFTFRCPRYRVWGVVLDALVDTGSPFTAITPKDSVRLQIPFSKLPRDPKLPPISFGAYKFAPRLMHGVELIFKDEEGKRHALEYYPFYALEPQLPREKWGENIYRLPNVIGIDFLKKRQIRIHLDPSLAEFTLEFKGSEKI